MTPAWAQRQAELLSDCIVSPNVFHHMVDRLRDFVMPYQQAFETEAGKPTVCPSVASRNILLYQSLPISIPCRHANVRRRKDDPGVDTTARSVTA